MFAGVHCKGKSAIQYIVQSLVTLPTLKIIKHVKIKLHKMHVMVLFSVKIAVKETPVLYQSYYVIVKRITI